MSFRNVLMTGGICLIGLALLMGVADGRDEGLLPGSAKAPRGGVFASPSLGSYNVTASSSTPDRRHADGRGPSVPPGLARSDDPPSGPMAEAGDLLDRIGAAALNALRGARAAGDRVFGREPVEEAKAPGAD